MTGLDTLLREIDDALNTEDEDRELTELLDGTYGGRRI